MIKYLVSDLDGTLLKAGDVINKEDIEAINQFQKNGGELWIASGRGTSFINDLKEKGVFAKYMFGSTGSVLFNGEKDIILSKINKEDALMIMDYLDSNNETDYCLDTFDFIGHFAKADYGHYYAHMKRNESFKVVNPRDYFNDHEFILKFFVICKDDDVAYTIMDYINSHYDHRFKVYHADFGCLEIVNNSANKWYAIEYLLNELKINKEEIACIGDEGNDVLMIENAGVGFAMSNAKDEVKKKADYVVNSVKEAIEMCMGDL